jgi:hypothetical protein
VTIRRAQKENTSGKTLKGHKKGKHTRKEMKGKPWGENKKTPARRL